MQTLVMNRRNLPSGQTLECQVTFNEANELLIYDVIMPFKWSEGDTAVTPNDVMNFMKDAPADLTVRINSSGGEVGSALAIYNQLLEHKGKVTTVVDGYAFSSAGWLALAGQDRQICNGGLFMMHNPYLYDKIDSVEKIDTLKNRWETHRDSIVNIFTTRTSMKSEEVKNLMAAETYLSASEAVDKGLFHTVRNGKPETAMLNCLDVPAAALNKAEVPKANVQELRNRALNLKRQFSKISR